MIIADLATLPARSFPARRTTRNLVGGASPIAAKNFAAGLVILDPRGGQVPWHNHDQEEVYILLEGACQLCLNGELSTLSAGQAAYIPPHAFHQLTNLADTPAKMLYIYGPPGEVAHWRQELAGTLPKAGVGGIPPLPAGAHPQCTDPPK
jgi:quercetin dioxygenase-like cupin family protein